MKTRNWIIVSIVSLATLSAFARPYGDGPGDGSGCGNKSRQECVREQEGDCPSGLEGRGPQGPGMRENRGSRKGGEGAHLLRRLLSRGRWAKKLDLSDEQVEQLKQLAYDNRKEMISLKANVQLAQLEVKTAMDKETPDKTALMNAVDQAAMAKAAIEKKQIECQLRIKEILTDEQIEKLHDRRSSFREGRYNQDRSPQRKQRGPDED